MGREVLNGVPTAGSSRGGRLDSGEQPLDAVLAEEGLRAAGECPERRLRVIMSGQDRDGRGASAAPEGEQRFQAVQSRHAEIEKNPGRLPGGPRDERAKAVRAFQTVMASSDQEVPQPSSKSFVIVHNHNPHRARSLCAGRVRTNMARPTQPRGRLPLMA